MRQTPGDHHDGVADLVDDTLILAAVIAKAVPHHAAGAFPQVPHGPDVRPRLADHVAGASGFAAVLRPLLLHRLDDVLGRGGRVGRVAVVGPALPDRALYLASRHVEKVLLSPACELGVAVGNVVRIAVDARAPLHPVEVEAGELGFACPDVDAAVMVSQGLVAVPFLGTRLVAADVLADPVGQGQHVLDVS